MESTYGNRRHDKPKDYAKSLAEVIQKTFDRGGNLVIPSFAVGRTQELLYFIRHIKAENMVKVSYISRKYDLTFFAVLCEPYLDT